MSSIGSNTSNPSTPIEMNRITADTEPMQDIELDDQPVHSASPEMYDADRQPQDETAAAPEDEPAAASDNDIAYNSEKPVGFSWVGSKVFFHTLFLLEKNLRLYLKAWISTLVQLAAPFFIVFLLWFLSVLVNSIRPESYVQTNEIEVPVDALTKCTPRAGASCYTLAYTTGNNTFAQKIVDQIVSEYSLTDSDYISFPTQDEMLSFIVNNPNVTQTAISFSDDTSGLSNVFVAPDNSGTNVNFTQATVNATRYTLWYNHTRSSSLAERAGSGSASQYPGIYVVQLRQMIDNAILFLFTGERSLIRTNMEGFPRRASTSDGQGSIISQTGPQFFSLAASIPLVISMQMLATEKESMLRFGMVMMGLSSVAYWLSWIITFSFMAVLTTLVTMISGYIFQIHFFLRSNPLSLFLIFYIFSLSLIAVAILLSTFTNRGRTALIVGFLVLSVSFILNQFLASQEFVIVLFSPTCGPDATALRQFCVESWVRAIRVLLYFYAPFNFAKCFVDIQQKTASIYDPDLEAYIAPKSGYSVGDMFRSTSITNTFNIDNLPPTYHAILLLIMNIALYLIIGLYLDAVLNNNTGVKYKPWFFLQPSFWGLNIFGGKKKVSAESNAKSPEELAEMDEDVRKQYELVRNPAEELVLRVLNVKKAFKTNFGLPLISSEVNAVNGIDFGVRAGNVCAILGHNGCGKSTTFNMIVGLLKPSSGDIMFMDKSVRDNVSYIRQNLGICPQHDILFPTLSAWEHLKLYGSIKGMSRKQIKREATERLKAVELYDVRNKNASTYSGGMKRRLSVAIATIGSPELLLVDECTTGLDVSVRRRIWKLIHKMQSGNRVILMTTHSMEEAEALSNQIIIMQSGRIIASGNALQLKQKYGAGYNLSLICHESKIHDTIAMVARELPDATLTNANAGNLVFNVMPEHIIPLGHFIKKLEAITRESMKDNKAKADVSAETPSTFASPDTTLAPSFPVPQKGSESTSTAPHTQETSKQAYAEYTGLLKDWGISFTTLERVFLKLTDQKSQMGMDETNDETAKAIDLFERLKQQHGDHIIHDADVQLHTDKPGSASSNSSGPSYRSNLEVVRSAPVTESNEERDLISVSSANDEDAQ